MLYENVLSPGFLIRSINKRKIGDIVIYDVKIVKPGKTSLYVGYVTSITEEILTQYYKKIGNCLNR